jgi:16S rRNA (cytosine1402-N4)-methyltransferase
MRITVAAYINGKYADPLVMELGPAASPHQPVMAAEVLQHLAPMPGQMIVDGTLGAGGHSFGILPRLLPDGTLLGIDRDPAALLAARRRLTEFEPRVRFRQGNFRDLPAILRAEGLSGIDGLVLDLGMSSLHVDQPQRGFSFLHEGPLDMRMDQEQGATAEDLVNHASLDELARLFTEYGEERYAHRIASRILEARRRERITRTSELADIVKSAVPPQARYGRIHPATRVFQALRIAVNDELGALRDVLAALPDVLKPGARAVIISFHSLEDRLVKHAFLEGARAGTWTVLTKKPVTASDDEIERNPRARSAKLRAIMRDGTS